MSSALEAALEASAIQRLIHARLANLKQIAEQLPAHLALIEAAAAGQPVPREALLDATGSILENLYKGVLSTRVSVPRDFWQSPFGVTIARAHAQVVTDAEVVSQAEAAQILGVSREYISQLVEGGRVATVVREAAAPRSRKQPREMIYRVSIDALKPSIRSASRQEVKETAWNDGRTSDYAGSQYADSGPSDEAGGHSGSDGASAPRLPEDAPLEAT